MPLNTQIISYLKEQGAQFIHFVNISSLQKEQNKGFHSAILIGIPLSPHYLRMVSKTPDYVKNMVQNKEIDIDEFHIKEVLTDKIADDLATWLNEKGYTSYSQSEKNILETNFYNENEKRTPLPHKTIAGYAGIGWIGKHNLLVTEEFGSGISMCTVLTNAPVESKKKESRKTLCGNCNVCKEICKENAITGNNWHINGKREDIIDVFKCTTCLECMVHCIWTQKYIQKLV